MHAGRMAGELSDIRIEDLLVGALTPALLVLKADGTIVFGNPGAAALLGAEPKVLTGLVLQTVLPECLHQPLLARARTILEGLPSNEAITFVASPSGLPVVFELSPGTPSERRLVLVTLRRRDQRAAAPAANDGIDFQKLVESLPSMVWTCLPEGPCDYLGPQWINFTGVSEASQLEYGWLNQIHPEDRDAAMSRWRASRESGQSFEMDYRIRRFDGEHYWFESRMTPLHDADGKVVKWLGIGTDVHADRSAQKVQKHEIEERMRTRTEELALLNMRLQTTAYQLAEAQKVAHVGSWTYYVDEKRIEWSEELFRIFGLKPSNGVPSLQRQAAIFGPNSWDRLRRDLLRTLETSVGYEIEVNFVRPDGETRQGNALCQAIRDNTGRVVGLIGTFQDVTDLVRARSERDRASERARIATTAAGVGVWDWDIQSDVLIWDDLMFSLYGFDESAKRPAPNYQFWHERLHPDDVADVDEASRQALSGEKRFNTSYRIRSATGKVRHLKAVAKVFHNADGKPVRMLGVNWDVTAEMELRQALYANETLLRQFVKHAPAAIAMLDRNLCYLQISDRWMVDYKLEGQDVIGKCHYDVFPEVPEHWKNVHRRALQGSVERCNEDPFPRSNGDLQWLEWEVRPWHRGDGEIGGIIFFTRLITEQKQMAQLLETQRDELARSNRDLEQFAYAASHDLQEPLRAVSGCAQLMEQRYRNRLDPAADELISHMVDGASRMQRLIRDLLEFSRVGQRGDHFAPVSSDRALAEALANLQEAIRENDAQVIAEGLPIVLADRVQLVAVFQNLVGNALKYRTEASPLIRVNARILGEFCEFSVEDNGMGIPLEYRQRIFEIFQRLHTRTEFPGTGIGLALCRKIVERHGGHIWVDSGASGGSIFRFTLRNNPS